MLDSWGFPANIYGPFVWQQHLDFSLRNHPSWLSVWEDQEGLIPSPRRAMRSKPGQSEPWWRVKGWPHDPGLANEYHPGLFPELLGKSLFSVKLEGWESWENHARGWNQHRGEPASAPGYTQTWGEYYPQMLQHTSQVYFFPVPPWTGFLTLVTETAQTKLQLL